MKETKEIIFFIDAFTDGLARKLEDDGKIDFSEIMATAFSNTSEAIAATVGAWKVSDEIANMSEEDKKQMLDMTLPLLVKIANLFLTKAK